MRGGSNRNTGLVVTALLLSAGVAEAHVGTGGASGLAVGFLHPITGLDHVVAMIAVGLWGAQLGKPAIWLLPITFPLVMAFGGFLGLLGVSLSGVEIGIALSGILLGAAVLAEIRPPLVAAAILVGVFAIFHGYAHGAELPPGENALFFSLGFVIATGLLHATGIVIGLLYQWPWGKITVRAAGGAVGAVGALFLWNALA
ncbi:MULTISPECIES: HupE/UreJ family protein [unclassified Rhizobium]|uniref:HupE/UreJ family protein n=1 Tax=unclassified Rhizobium TaxID=2613769 RepID=UPI0007EBC6C8|nr:MULTISPECIES: HupE/UreJ family protein [unclassified Rhizobium]ANM14712.1 HupE/UreJ protein [Rhizobium sp. N324]ANM21101.1 HupE/UreJ protein [Rhizobium sp. N541]ANM27472.1 HupE/UreJ protein [Rhizobium sp. N941]OYC99815.1 HupE/UreJ protein [Rhizobium sp. N4311]